MDVLISRFLGRNHTIQFCILAAIVVAIFAFGCWDGAWQEPVDFRYHGRIRATSAAVLFCSVVGSSLLLGDMYSRSIHNPGGTLRSARTVIWTGSSCTSLCIDIMIRLPLQPASALRRRSWESFCWCP